MAWASSEPPHFHLFHFLTHAIYGWIINRCMCDDQQNQSLKGSVNWSVDASRHSMDQLTCVSKRSNDWPDTERRCAPHGLLQLQVASCRTFCRHGRRRWGQFISLFFFLSLKLTRSSPLFFTRALAFACIRSWAEPRCCLSHMSEAARLWYEAGHVQTESNSAPVPRLELAQMIWKSLCISRARGLRHPAVHGKKNSIGFDL